MAEIEVPLPTSPEELRTGPGLLILRAVAAGELEGHAREEGVVSELRAEEERLQPNGREGSFNPLGSGGRSSG